MSKSKNAGPDSADPTAHPAGEYAPAEMTLDELRPVLVRDMLPDVAFDGWGWEAAEAAAERLDVPAERVKLLFPAGPIDMIVAWLRIADEDMLAALSAEGVSDMKIRDRIRRAVEIRLEQAEPNKEAVREASKILAYPRHAMTSVRSLWTTVDAMWRIAGDTATDYNYYTKRGILSGVYSSTLLYWLQDDSEDFADTRAFLSRRIDNVMQFEKGKAELLRAKRRLPSISRFFGRLRYPGV
ncbi:COQ9 family protein [Pacificimonas sp. WHA3]|uniref:COQ9 family protein n=2 Tax=Pacificimonas pallii TaxID=2827236 RepID=A0ABS6SCP3_9SPHN|nr:COQ9 family protein [Pacificimonas pallii]